MKITIKKEILLINLNKVAKALATKNLIPYLTGIKFELTEKGLYLIASNDDIIIQSFIPNKNILTKEGLSSLVVPGKYILEIIKKIPDQEILLKNDGLKIIIKTKTGEYKLNGINPTEYPKYNLSLNKEFIKINSNLLKEAINQTVFAVSTQEERPLLTGINLKLENNKLVFLATDSYRLSQKVITIDNKTNQTANLTIPGKNMLELVKLLEDVNTDLELHLLNNSVIFKIENTLLQSRLLNGSYPTFPNHFQTDYKINILLERELFYNIIDLVALIEKEKNIINLQGTGKELIISAVAEEVGKIEERILLEEELNSTFTISFNSKYMMDALRSLKNKNVIVNISNTITPIFIKSPNEDDLLQLVVPIKNN